MHIKTFDFGSRQLTDIRWTCSPKSREYSDERSYALAFEFLPIPEICSVGGWVGDKLAFLLFRLFTASGVWRESGVGPTHHVSRVQRQSRWICAFAPFRGARCTCTCSKTAPKNGFHACRGQMLQRRITRICEKTIIALWLRSLSKCPENLKKTKAIGQGF